MYWYYWNDSFSDISNARSTLEEVLYRGREPHPFEQVLTLIL